MTATAKGTRPAAADILAPTGRDAGCGAGSGPFRVGRWRIDPALREVSDGARSTRISPRAMGVLTVLADAHGGVVRRDVLIEAVWHDVIVSDESLTQAVAELRRAFGDRRAEARVVETVQKAGYRLAAPVLRDVSKERESRELSLATAQGSVPGVPLEAYVAVSEARALSRRCGITAAETIAELAAEAGAAARDNAMIQADAAALLGLVAVHAGDDSRVRLSAALRTAERAAELRPDLLATHRAVGFLAGATGRAELSRAPFERALAIDHTDFETHYLAAQVFFVAGQYRTSVILGKTAAAMAPDDYRPAYNASRAALALGDRRTAIAMAQLSLRRLDALLELTPDEGRRLSARAASCALLSETQFGCTAPPEPRRSGDFFYDVVAHTHLGELDIAIDMLEAMADKGWCYPEWLRADPVYAQLSGERRFRRLVDALEAA